MRPARPKNLATNKVAWPCDSADSIHWRQGRRMHVSLQPFRRTLHPLQLIFSAKEKKKTISELTRRYIQNFGSKKIGYEVHKKKRK